MVHTLYSQPKEEGQKNKSSKRSLFREEEAPNEAPSQKSASESDDTGLYEVSDGDVLLKHHEPVLEMRGSNVGVKVVDASGENRWIGEVVRRRRKSRSDSDRESDLYFNLCIMDSY